MLYNRKSLTIVLVTLSALCCCLLLAAGQARATGVSILFLDSQTASQLKFLSLQLDLELESLIRAEKRLSDAEAQFEATSAELLKAQARAGSKPGPEAERDVRIIGVRYARHEKKVVRCKNRILEVEANVQDFRRRIALLKDPNPNPSAVQKPIKPKSGNNTQTSNKPVKRISHSNNQPAKPFASQSKKTLMPLASNARLVAASQSGANLMPADWPYLSSARGKDKLYASERLLELKGMSPKQLKLEAPLDAVKLTAMGSFGVVVMEYIGGDLFSTVRKVNAGRQLFEVLNLKQWHTIPERDNQKAYRFIFDVSTVSEPRLILFNNDLLNK